MQVKSEPSLERQAKQTSPTATHKLVRGSTLRDDGKRNGHEQSLGKSHPKRRNRQKKKSSGKSKSNTEKRENGNVDPPTTAVDQKIEPGRDLRSPFKGIRTVFQGNPRSKVEIQNFQINQPSTRPATPGPSSKKQHRKRDGLQPTRDPKETVHQQSSTGVHGVSSVHIHDRKPTSGPTGLTQQAPGEQLNPRRDSDAAKSVNQSQKKPRNRKKSKRGSSPNKKAADQSQPGQLDPPVAYEGYPPKSNVVQTSLLNMTNRPPPIPTIEFEVKSDMDFRSEKGSNSVTILEQDMVPKIDRTPRKDTVDKPFFPRNGGVVRILQNKNRGMDIGCTQTRKQQLQRSIPQDFAAIENGHQNHPPLTRSGRMQSPVSKVQESEIMLGKQDRIDCHDPSPGASSAPSRTQASSQDVRNDGEASRIRRTAWKTRRKRFHK